MAEIIDILSRRTAEARAEVAHIFSGEHAPTNLGPAVDKAMGFAREADLRQQERIKNEALAARGDAKRVAAVCPSLLIGLAAEVGLVAGALENLAAKAKALGCVKQYETLASLIPFIEIAAVEIEAPAYLDGDA